MDQNIQEFVDCKRVAVVGVSRTGKGFGNIALAELRKRGYEAFPVHREAPEIDGEACYPNLAALNGQAQAVVVSVPPDEALKVVEEAAALGLRHVWLQRGAESPEVLARAQALGLSVVGGKCILMYAQPVRSVHKWHRGFVKLTGRL